MINICTIPKSKQKDCINKNCVFHFYCSEDFKKFDVYGNKSI